MQIGYNNVYEVNPRIVKMERIIRIVRVS